MGRNRTRELESSSTYSLLFPPLFRAAHYLCGSLDGLVGLNGFRNLPEGWCKASGSLWEQRFITDILILIIHFRRR